MFQQGVRLNTAGLALFKRENNPDTVFFRLIELVIIWEKDEKREERGKEKDAIYIPPPCQGEAKISLRVQGLHLHREQTTLASRIGGGRTPTTTTTTVKRSEYPFGGGKSIQGSQAWGPTRLLCLIETHSSQSIFVNGRPDRISFFRIRGVATLARTA